MQGLSVKGMKKSIVKSSAVLLGSYLQGAFSSQTAVQAAFLSSFNTHRTSSSLHKSNLKLQRYTSFTGSSLLTSTRMSSTSSTDASETLLLPYEDGSHGSAKIIVDMESDLYNPGSLSIDDFKQRLEATIIACKELNKSALWLEVHMSQARYIQACTDIPDMDLHHTEGAMIKLSLWLKDNSIPFQGDWGTSIIRATTFRIIQRTCFTTFSSLIKNEICTVSVTILCFTDTKFIVLSNVSTILSRVISIKWNIIGVSRVVNTTRGRSWWSWSWYSQGWCDISVTAFSEAA